MRRLRWALAAIVIAIVPMAIGCDRREARDRDGAPVVDVELMAFLSQARALHHQANLKEDSGDLAGAADAMDRLLGARRPHSGRSLPELEEVLADAHARLAELHLRRGAFGPAADAVTKGLEHAPDPTYFRGHLLEVDGLIEEARAAGFADAGRPEEASRARAKALEVLEEVVRIQRQVIDRSLAGRDAGTEGLR